MTFTSDRIKSYVLNYSKNEKCFRKELYRKSQHTSYNQQLLSENGFAYETVLKNMVQPDRAQMTIYSAWVLHVV